MAGPLLTPDTSGNPRVEVFFDPDDLHADCAGIRIYRYSEDRRWLVRGGVDIAPGVAALDFECPFNIDAQYRAEQFDDTGASLGFSDSETTQLEYTGTVVHQPLDPSLWVRMRLLKPTADSLTRGLLGGDPMYPEGDVVATIVGGRRVGLEDTTLALLADSVSDADVFQAALGTYEVAQVNVLCVRTSESVRIPRTFFAAGRWSEVRRDVTPDGGFVEFRSTAREAKPPFAGLVVPLLTYDDLDAAYATYDLRDAAYATYTAQDRDYSLAGLAG